MKVFTRLLLVATFLMVVNDQLESQIIWDGAPKTFTKANFTDWTLPVNQDRITEDIWITRQNSKPIFNIAQENLAESPLDTRWAVGSISDGVENLSFTSWGEAVEFRPPDHTDIDMVLYLVSDNIYIDIKFTSWSSGGSGGFSYQRSTGSMSDTYWTGAPVTFTKPDYSNWHLPENQDRITDNVWITRANYEGLFNITKEEYYDISRGLDPFMVLGPLNTKWAFGTIADGVGNLMFKPWAITIGWNPPEAVDENMVLFLESDSIYIDIKFTSWKSGQDGGGGGFSYERSTGDISETMWTGPKMTFTKDNFADWSQKENQDRITNDVWITRANQQGIFNAVHESSYTEYLTIPSNTLWAFGKTDDGIENLNFDYFIKTANYEPPTLIGKDMVLKLLPDDIYIDIKFTSWTTGADGGGGGFSYERSTEPGTAVLNNLVNSNDNICFPNPASDFINLKKQFESISPEFVMYNMLGTKVLSEKIMANRQINVNHLARGLYIYQIKDSGSTFEGKIILK